MFKILQDLSLMMAKTNNKVVEITNFQPHQNSCLNSQHIP